MGRCARRACRAFSNGKDSFSEIQNYIFGMFQMSVYPFEQILLQVWSEIMTHIIRFIVGFPFIVDFVSIQSLGVVGQPIGFA